MKNPQNSPKVNIELNPLEARILLKAINNLSVQEGAIWTNSDDPIVALNNKLIIETKEIINIPVLKEDN